MPVTIHGITHNMVIESFLILNYSKGVSVMNQQFCLNDIKPGQHATVSSLRSTGSMRRRLLDIGLIENTDVECLGRSPGGDPTAFLIRGAVIAIRSEDCRKILIHAL
jgi:ferrous iron transport protein A